jgi:hypothetical protein
MRLTDVLGSEPTQFADIRANCSLFIAESAGVPIRKALPSSYQDIHRVKVRQQKRSDVITHVFNEAFSDVRNLRQRAVIAYDEPTILENQEPFYIFPVNGYRFLYSKEVKNSSSDYKQVIDTLFEQFSDMERAAEIITDVVKYTYTNVNLHEGLQAGAEIIFYNIPYYYAVKQSLYPEYKNLITHIK